MPVDPDAPTLISAFDHVPGFAQGRVRDLRLRWALEEIGRPYRVELMDAYERRPDDYRAWQPFGQVPAFDDGKVRLFESGAILLYLGEQDERLLPRDTSLRWTATAWAIAALNSVEPMIMQLVSVEVFNAGEPWAGAAGAKAMAALEPRLRQLAEALGDREWLAGAFSIADILMVTVLRNLPGGKALAGTPTLADYVARGEQRPAFQRALADQCAAFVVPQAEGTGA